MKPLQIGLLVLAGALCGAVVMRVAERARPVLPPVTAEIPPEPAQPAAEQAQTPAPAEPANPQPAAGAPQQTAAASPAAAAPKPAPALANGAGNSGATAEAGSRSPSSARRGVKKPRPERAAHSEPVRIARVRPSYVPPRPAASVAMASPRPSRPAQTPAPAAVSPNPAPTPPSAAEPAAAEPEPTASTLPPARADAENATPPSPPMGVPQAPPPEPNRVTLIAGLLIPVRLVDGLSSERNQPGDMFHATLARELEADGFVIAERGARVEGRVIAVDRGGRVSGVASMAVVLTTVHTSDGQAVAIQTDPFNRHAEQTHLQDAEKIGGAAAFGAIIGALAGGGTGAAAGAGVGGGAGAGAVLLTRGAAAKLPPETQLTFRLKTTVTITERQ
jgi:hypothetical protein